MKVMVFPNRLPNNRYFERFLVGLRKAGVRDVRLVSVLSLRSDSDLMHFHFPEQVVAGGSWLKATFITVAVSAVMLYARLLEKPGIM